MRLLGAALSAAILIVGTSAANGDDGRTEIPDPTAAKDAFEVGLTTQEAPRNDGRTPVVATSGSVTYSMTPVCVRGEGGPDGAYYGCAEQQTCGADGLQSWVWEHAPDGSTRMVGTYCSEGATTALPVDTLTPGRILEAFQRVDLPEAPLEVQPPGGVTLVNFDTILHTDAQPFTETVQLLNRQITFDIEPSEFTWTLGDGRTLTTTDPGRAWRAGLPMDEYVSHRYAEAGTVRLQLTTTWSARWRLPNGPWRPVAGTVEIASPPQDLEITTARPQLVSYD